MAQAMRSPKMPNTTFLLLGGGKIEHSIFHFFVFLTFAGAKVLLFYDIRKRKEEKIFARQPPAAEDTP